MKQRIFELCNKETREKALASGEIIDLSKSFNDEVKQNYKYSVYTSAAAWRVIVSGSSMMDDLNTFVWNFLFMSKAPGSELENSFSYVFDALMPVNGDWILYRQFKKYLLFDMLFPGWVFIVISLPDE